ncbi:MAG TPA: malonyl-[acyl-carrier protein] O-methyltransferase BioC, partial [Xanthomonadaceae bacterium]|nr:malonyl-[acyl-carrier protein] O-methyltransferase BioC [Xanthomonadaceae bacterium]
MSASFDPRQVRRAFARAAAGYAQAATLQREVETRLLESLDALGDRV